MLDLSLLYILGLLTLSLGLGQKRELTALFDVLNLFAHLLDQDF